MYTPFNELPGSTRVWIYQSNRELLPSEVEVLRNKTEQFVKEWTAHKNQLKASFEVLYNRFLILAVDEKEMEASGCSIDGSVRFVKEMEKFLNVNFFDRMNFAYKKDDKVLSSDRLEFERLVSMGEITDDTIVFNNMVSTISDMQQNWEVTFATSWHKQLVL